jgi:hypothetical protein
MLRSASILALMAAVLFLACGAAGAQTSSAVHVGSSLKAPQKTKDVKPVYPPTALASHVQGIVILEATLGTDGKVKDAKVYGRYRCSTKPRSTRCGNGSSRQHCLMVCRCQSS